MTCYGSGVRISEAVSLKLSDIDSHRMLIRVEHGKGGKDRYSMLSPCLLEILRAYCRILRPAGPWLFPSWRPHLIWLPDRYKPFAAKPGRAAACANASPPTCSVTALRPIC